MTGRSERSHPGSPEATPGFVPVLQGLRALAALTVVMFHVSRSVNYAPSNSVLRHLLESSGFLSFYMLFFITGFVLFLPVVRHGGMGSVRSFAIRRFARMAPNYYVCLLLILAAMPLLGPASIRQHIPTGPQDLAIHFVFLHWYLIPADTGFGADAPMWTISLDATFYVLFPLIATAYLRRPVLGLVLGLGIATAWRVAFLQAGVPPLEQNLRIWLQELPLFCGDIAAGMTGAWLLVHLRRRGVGGRNPRACAAIALGALVGLLGIADAAGASVATSDVFEEPWFLATLFPLCLLVFVLAMALAPRRVQWPLANRPVLWLGEISYSIYLYHFPVICFARYTVGVKPDGNFPLRMMAVVLPLTLVLATVSYYLVERPARDYAHRLTARLAAKRSIQRATHGGADTVAAWK